MWPLWHPWRNSTLSFHPHGPMSHKVQGCSTPKEQNQLPEKTRTQTPCTPNFSGPAVVYRDVGIFAVILCDTIKPLPVQWELSRFLHSTKAPSLQASRGPSGHSDELSSHLQRLHTVFAFTSYCRSNLWTLADGIGTSKPLQNCVEGNRSVCFKSS